MPLENATRRPSAENILPIKTSSSSPKPMLNISVKSRASNLPSATSPPVSEPEHHSEAVSTPSQTTHRVESILEELCE